MAFVDAFWQPDYVVKSIVKVLFFIGLPVVFYSVIQKKSPQFLKINIKGLVVATVLGFFVYAVIVGGYLITKEFFDYTNITNALATGVGVDAKNFIFVALYISLVNSFLEEFFFRGFAFLELKKYCHKSIAFCFSSGVFAFYHVAIMVGWYAWPLFILTMVGLLIGGAMFNLLNEKSQNIYCSWIVHMFANFGINTIGFILFGLI